MPARCTLSHQSRSHGHGTEDNPLAEDIHAICNILASKAPSPTKYDRELLLNEINLNDVLVTWVKLLIWTHTHTYGVTLSDNEPEIGGCHRSTIFWSIGTERFHIWDRMPTDGWQMHYMLWFISKVCTPNQASYRAIYIISNSFNSYAIPVESER